MRINLINKTLDIEERDIQYFMQAYIRLYLFQAKNIDPDEIVLPMWDSVAHPKVKGVRVPIRYVPVVSEEAVDIIQDGKDIKMSSAESEAKADRDEASYNKMKARIEELEKELAGSEIVEHHEMIEDHVEEEKQSHPKSAIAGVDTAHLPSPARLAIAKEAPGGVIPPGTQADYGGSRDASDAKQIAKDLLPDKEVREEEEQDASEIVSRAKKIKK